MIYGLSKRKLNKAGKELNEVTSIVLPHAETLLKKVQSSINEINKETGWTIDQTLKLIELLENKQFSIEEETYENEPLGFATSTASNRILP